MFKVPNQYTWLSFAVSLLIGYVTSTIIYRIFFHPLRNIPGPLAARATEIWRTTKYFRGNWHQDILDLHNKYGPVVRIAPNEVSFVDKDALVTIYGHAKGTRKTNWYHAWSPPDADPSMFNTTDPKRHSFLRKRVTAAYSMSGILGMEPRISAVASAFFPRLRALARDPRTATIALDHWIPLFAFDVVGALALGAPLGFVAAGRDTTGIIDAIHDYFFWSANLGHVPFQQRVVMNPVALFALRAVGGQPSGGVEHLSRWMRARLQERRERGPPGEGEEGDMLDHFLAMRDEKGGPAGERAVLTECGNIIAAGADTTSIGIRSVLGPLMLHEDSYKRVQREVDEAYMREGLRDDEGNSGMPFAIAEKLPFLEACVKEGLRLHPSITYQMPREVPLEGVSVRGFYIPASATVSISPVSQNRCREVYGEDADEWRPERWIVGEGSDEQTVRDMNKFNTTFGYGSRTCVGKNLAYVEIFKFVAELLHQFDLELVNKERPWVCKSMWFSDQGNMIVRIKERSGNILN